MTPTPTPTVSLREVRDGDLAAFWEHATDPGAQHMAAMTRGHHYDRSAFDTHWAKVRSDPAVTVRTILADGEAAGHVAVYGPPEEREVTYTVGRPYWGRGVATAALRALLVLEPARPLYGFAAADNTGSVRVLEKCGFLVTGSVREYARARGEEIEFVRLVLPAPAEGP
ncbi:GNAT family N-acetyltransferase [Streptomyces sp. NPDC089799]|uniref:GNAT family N-acetyltransferase n=1 Tax=Streptomyces sp. NPDC089799 TaxID=3155066 RepID=UPI00343FB76A